MIAVFLDHFPGVSLVAAFLLLGAALAELLGNAADRPASWRRERRRNNHRHRSRWT